jgi:hypothetical protein
MADVQVEIGPISVRYAGGMRYGADDNGEFEVAVIDADYSEHTYKLSRTDAARFREELNRFLCA